MTDDEIHVGDIVNVYFEYVQCEFGVTVLYSPVATGDSWRFRRPDGNIVYVQAFTKIEKVAP